MSRAPGGGHSHWPVSDPLFCIFFSLLLNASFFTTFYTQWPPVVGFSVKIFQRNQKCVKIAWILCNFAPNDPPFLDLSPNESNDPPLFARKLSLMVPQFDASVWAPLSLLYVSAPPGVSILQENPNYSPALNIICQILPQLQSYGPNQGHRFIFLAFFCDDSVCGGVTVPNAHLGPQGGIWRGMCPLRSWKILYFWNWNRAIWWIRSGTNNLEQAMSKTTDLSTWLTPILHFGRNFC